MQNNIKKIIIFLLIILIMITLIIFWLTKQINTEDVVTIYEMPEPAGTEIKHEEINEFFYSVKSIINEYYIQISNIADENSIISRKAQKEVYNKLGAEYIQEQGITLDNIYTKIQSINFEKLLITEMLVTNELDGIYTYFVKGKVIADNEENILDMNIMLIIDRMQSCFSIYPQEYLEKHEYYNKQIGENVEVSENKNKLKKNQYNTFTASTGITSKAKAQDLLEHFKMLISYAPNEAVKRFNTKDSNIIFSNNTTKEVLSYLKQKQMRMSLLDSFNVEKKEEYREYTCKDTNGNGYIFREISPFNYTVILEN